MASVMGICVGLVWPKRENVEKALVSIHFMKGLRGALPHQESFQSSEPGRPGRGRGEGKLSPLWACLRFGGVGRFRTNFRASQNNKKYKNEALVSYRHRNQTLPRDYHTNRRRHHINRHYHLRHHHTHYPDQDRVYRPAISKHHPCHSHQPAVSYSR